MRYLKKNYVGFLLAFLFLSVLAIRLSIAFQTPYFSDDGSYLALRQIDEITSTGTPLYHDPLSYGGRLFIFPPLFHYILAVFNILLPLSSFVESSPIKRIEFLTFEKRDEIYGCGISVKE